MVVIISCDWQNSNCFGFSEFPSESYYNEEYSGDIYSEFYKEKYPHVGRKSFSEFLESRGFKRVSMIDVPF